MGLADLKRKMKETSYVMKLRPILQNASIEELKLTKQEVLKEIERRNRK